jgi:acyl dehydratase
MKTIDYDDVEVGTEGPFREHTLTRTDLVKYAGASGDFNPMHHDEILAKAAGMPSVFGHGMFSMGFLGAALTDWVGPGRVVKFRVRFSKQTWPGETLITKVVVIGKRIEGDRRLVDVSCTLANDAGEVKVIGSATLEPA